MAVNTNFDFNELLRQQGGTPNAGYALTPEEQLQNQLIVRNQNQSKLLENYRDLPTEPEQKNGFGNKLLQNLPAILSALHYVAQSTSKSTESQRNAYGMLQNNMELFRQRKEQRRQRGIESLEAKRKKLAQQIQAEGGISELLQSQYNAKQKAKQEAFDQSLQLANSDRLSRATSSDIERNNVLNKATESTQKRESESYNAQRDIMQRADKIFARMSKTPELPLSPEDYATVKKAYPDYVTPEEQRQSFMQELEKRVDAEVKLAAGGDEWDDMTPEERLQWLDQMKQQRMDMILSSLGGEDSTTTNQGGSMLAPAHMESTGRPVQQNNTPLTEAEILQLFIDSGKQNKAKQNFRVPLNQIGVPMQGRDY